MSVEMDDAKTAKFWWYAIGFIFLVAAAIIAFWFYPWLMAFITFIVLGTVFIIKGKAKEIEPAIKDLNEAADDLKTAARETEAKGEG